MLNSNWWTHFHPEHVSNFVIFHVLFSSFRGFTACCLWGWTACVGCTGLRSSQSSSSSASLHGTLVNWGKFLWWESWLKWSPDSNMRNKHIYPLTLVMKCTVILTALRSLAISTANFMLQWKFVLFFFFLDKSCFASWRILYMLLLCCREQEGYFDCDWKVIKHADHVPK